jgi:ketosteroid isomerase-like protein
MRIEEAMTPDDFVSQYEQALASQDWTVVEPLVHDDACVTFSTGEVHKGKPAVRRAFEQNFSAIADEEYRISNVHWVHRGEEVAAYLFDFQWSGRIGGRAASGSGRGTAVLRHEDGSGWRLLVEHLGPQAS